MCASVCLCYCLFVCVWMSVIVFQCSASCGKGERARYVSCRDAQGGVADDSYCAHLPRPPESSVCFSPCGHWREGEWSPVRIITKLRDDCSRLLISFNPLLTFFSSQVLCVMWSGSLYTTSGVYELQPACGRVFLPPWWKTKRWARVCCSRLSLSLPPLAQ